MITIQNLSKSYGKKEVLKGIDLSFSAGEVYGIVGENGAGKTTLFNCIAGLIPFNGSVSYANGKLKDHLGYLETTPYFFSRMTGREYLRLLGQARKQPIQHLDQRNVFQLPLDEYAIQYSTGMQKKLALMGLLLQQNQVLILDEPFNGVDIQSNLIIKEVIHELKRLGKLILISSHIFSTLHETCDQIFHLGEGRIKQQVNKAQFAEFEAEMKAVTIGDALQKLALK